VGLKLEVEPLIHLEDDVEITVGLEVSNIVKEIQSTSGTLTYQLGTRNAATALRLHDGETQVLAGLISDEDRRSADRIPGLGELPVAGRLFSQTHDNRTKTEIVLLITPHLLRTLNRPEVRTLEFAAGTETSTGAPGAIPGPFISPAVPRPETKPETRPPAPTPGSAATPAPTNPPAAAPGGAMVPFGGVQIAPPR
jgi:general secretion pathway protein D